MFCSPARLWQTLSNLTQTSLPVKTILVNSATDRNAAFSEELNQDNVDNRSVSVKQRCSSTEAARPTTHTKDCSSRLHVFYIIISPHNYYWQFACFNLFRVDIIACMKQFGAEETHLSFEDAHSATDSAKRELKYWIPRYLYKYSALIYQYAMASYTHWLGYCFQQHWAFIKVFQLTQNLQQRIRRYGVRLLPACACRLDEAQWSRLLMFSYFGASVDDRQERIE